MSKSLGNGVDPLKVIEEYAFYKCSNLKNIKLPNNIININKHAFNGCSELLLSELPNNLKIIGE